MPLDMKSYKTLQKKYGIPFNILKNIVMDIEFEFELKNARNLGELKQALLKRFKTDSYTVRTNIKQEILQELELQELPKGE